MLRAGITLVFLLASACDGEEESVGAADGGAVVCAPPNRVVGDACREPGVQDDGCPAGTLGLGDGTCRPAGIAPGMCGDGFVHDGDVGCEPVLPADSCARGLMAVPGDAECRPVTPCAPGKWGDIEIDATTEHVDDSYAGSDSDGTADKPWTTIADALVAAAPGATIAVAAGTYSEDVLIQGDPVVLWGVCPGAVEIVATGASFAAVNVQASDAVVRGVAVTGADVGIAVSGAEHVVVDRVWVHDNAQRGIHVEDALGPTSCTVTGSLVEHNQEIGVFVGSSAVTLEKSVVRATAPTAQMAYGRGVDVEDGGGAPASAILRGCLVEQNHRQGVFVYSSEVSIEATVVRGTLADGVGFGRGIEVTNPESSTSKLSLQRSLVADNHDVGLVIAGSEATVDASIVRGSAALGDGGVAIHMDPIGGQRASVDITSSLVEQNWGFGVFVSASDVSVQSTVVRSTWPGGLGDGDGQGIQVQADLDDGTPSTANVRGSVVTGSSSFGVAAISSDVVLHGSRVASTVASAEGDFGDGVTAFAFVGPSTVSVEATRIEDSARAGLSSFAGSTPIRSSVVQCAAFALEGEVYDGAPFSFEDRGGNACGCPSAEGNCLVSSVGLAPPVPATFP